MVDAGGINAVGNVRPRIIGSPSPRNVGALYVAAASFPIAYDLRAVVRAHDFASAVHSVFNMHSVFVDGADLPVGANVRRAAALQRYRLSGRSVGRVGMAPRISATSRRIPFARRGVPVSCRRVPLARRRVPMTCRSIPFARRRVPMTCRSIPFARRCVSMARRRIPMARRCVPVARRCISVACRRISVARRRIRMRLRRGVRRRGAMRWRR